MICPDRRGRVNLFETRITSQFLGLARHTSPEHFERLMPVGSFLLLGFSAHRDCATSSRPLLTVHLIHRFVRSARCHGIERRKRTGFHFPDFTLLRVVADIDDNGLSRRFRSFLTIHLFSFISFTYLFCFSNKAA